MHRCCCLSAAISVHCTKSCIYSQKVLLRMGEFVARNIPAISVHCTKSCIYSQKVLLRMGEFIARNM